MQYLTKTLRVAVLIYKNKIIFIALFSFFIILLVLFFSFFGDFKSHFAKEENISINTSFKELNESKQEENVEIYEGLFADFKKKDRIFFENNQSILPSHQVFELSEKKEDINFLFDFNLSKEQLLMHQKNHFDFLKSLNFSSTNSNEKKVSTKDDKSKPKLVVIIDDVSSKEQARAIKSLDLKITPSFFPADKNHPNTKNYAKDFDFFMVHLPLQAKNYTKEELETLKIYDTQEKIDLQIAKIKKDFTHLKFINNHTGSLFTSDEEAMYKLLKAFENHDLIFVDSLTAGSSKVEQVLENFNQIYIKRDVFLDNEENIDYIKAQLKQAIKIAQKQGFAIVIGHPKKNTFQALRESKKLLLDEVELVYLDELYENP